MKITLQVILILFSLSFVGVLLKYLFFPAHVANKTADTVHGVVDQTLNADNALSNYEEFKDLYNGAKEQAQNIKNAEKSIEDLKALYGYPSTWTKDVREDYTFLKQNVDGYLMQYQSIVKEYNANSSNLNRNLFKDSDLPAELPLDYKELR